MPFGLVNAPSSFQRAMNNLLNKHGWKFAMIYLDDIIIFSSNFDTHMKHLVTIISELTQNQLKINYAKSEYFCNEIEYLGYKIKRDNITISDEKIKSIQLYPKPKTIKQIHQFVRLTSYYRRFILNYSKIAMPLTELLKKDSIFVWEEKQNNAFEQLKNYLIKSPTVRIPDPSKNFIVTIDACQDGLGAVLTQKDENEEYVFAFGSRKCNKFENNYSTYELECLGLDFALKIWRCYLIGKKFTVYTDCNALTHIMKKKDATGRIARMILRFQDFEFDIHYKPGKLNKVADALSRNAIIANIEYKISTLTMNENVPETQHEKEKIVMEHHRHIGHANASTTYKSLRNYFFWKSMRNDVSNIVPKCEECIKFNESRNPDFNYPILVGEALERIGIDTIGPFVTSDNGDKYILIGVDYLTKYIFMKAVPKKSAEQVANFIYEKIILEQGCPAIILTDNGKEFNNEMVKNLCEKMNINKKFSSPYRPQTNGLVERTNKTIIGILAKNAYNEKTKWDKYIDLIRFNYNIRFQENLQTSPFELMYGRFPNLPYSLQIDTKKESVEERMKRIKLLQENIMNRRRTDQTKKLKEIKECDKLKIGDVVMYRQPIRQDKLQPKWIGPYVIVANNSNVSCIIQDLEKKIEIVAHRKQLKRVAKDNRIM